MLAYKNEYLPNYTYDDYQAWEGDWELIYGVPYAMSPAPNITHQELNLNIGVELKQKLKACKNCKALPEVDWKINDETLVRPDSLVVCDLSTNKAYLSKTPEIIFEVLSPSTKSKDRNFKSLLYAQNDVKYYVLVEPAGMFAEVYELKNGKYKLQGEFKNESYHFDLENVCTFEFSFAEVFDI
ncbi:MAG TPA: Uma2 family endonuclease [Campylobacterales bacterium]|nr:Uma2 family endonuclease [Campylobacterales bacterium]HHS92980.1 Uma2 family endonuclease [Campylobacterales bacterium]